MYNPIEAKRRFVQAQIQKSFDSGINLAEETNLEKAHQDGEMHPNGKWVWVSSANGGKGDWRTANGRAHKKHQEVNGKKATGAYTSLIRSIQDDIEFAPDSKISQYKERLKYLEHADEISKRISEKTNVSYNASNGNVVNGEIEYAQSGIVVNSNGNRHTLSLKEISTIKEAGSSAKQVKFSDKEKRELDQLQNEIDKMGFESRLSPDKEKRYNELKKKQFVAHIDSLNSDVVGKKQAHKNFIDYIEGNGRTKTTNNQTKNKAEEIISNFRSKYTTLFASMDGTPLANSNFAYSLTEKKRKEQFPFLESVGTEDQERAIDYVIGKSVNGGAKEVARALNASGLGDKWKAVRDEKELMELRSTDVWGTENRLFIKPRKTKSSKDKVKDVTQHAENYPTVNDISEPLDKKGYKVHVTTSGSVEVYKKGDRIAMKNLQVAYDPRTGYTNYGPNKNLEKLIGFIFEPKKSDKRDKIAQDAGFKDYKEMKGYQDYVTQKNLLKKRSTNAGMRLLYQKEVAKYEKDHADLIKRVGKK